MSRMSFPACCVVHDASRRHRPYLPDAVVIVVIAVLTCGLSVHGLNPSTVLAVLASAGLVSAATLMAVRGGGQRLGDAMLRAAHAVTAP